MSGPRPSFTLGIEEEYQTIDPVSRDLRSQIIAQGRMRLQERVKPEMHGSVVEIGTGICRTIAEARRRGPERHPEYVFPFLPGRNIRQEQ